MCRYKTTFWLYLAWIVLFGPSAFAQVPPPLPGAIQIVAGNISLSQSVTVSVQPINELSIAGDVDLTLSTSTPGSGLDAVSDALSATYSLTTNDTGKKISGAIDAPFSPGVTLSVLLGAPIGATSSIQNLSTTAVDLVTGIGYTAQTGLTITYTASASLLAAPNGSGESRTVTLTLMDN